MTDRVYIYAYDIADDRRRAKVSDLLADHGARIQHSLFEVVQTTTQAAALCRLVDSLLLPGDKLRVYPLPFGAIPDVHCYGGAPMQEGQDWWLL